MTFIRTIFTFILVISISGCVGAGIMYSHDKEENVSLTKSEVIKRFGEPIKVKSGKDKEVWYYEVKDEGVNGILIGLGIPLPLLILADEKLIIEFEGDTATKLKHKNSQQGIVGAFCFIEPTIHSGSSGWVCSSAATSRGNVG